MYNNWLTIFNDHKRFCEIKIIYELATHMSRGWVQLCININTPRLNKHFENSQISMNICLWVRWTKLLSLFCRFHNFFSSVKWTACFFLWNQCCSVKVVSVLVFLLRATYVICSLTCCVSLMTILLSKHIYNKKKKLNFSKKKLDYFLETYFVYERSVFNNNHL